MNCRHLLKLARQVPPTRRVTSSYRTLHGSSALFSSSDSPKGTPGNPDFPEPSIGRAVKILSDEFKLLAKGRKRIEEDIFPHYVDVVIIGGGIMGSSVAYWMKHKAQEGLRILVVERDQTYTRCSTTLSVGGLRQQFSLRENIEMSLFSAEFFRNIRSHLSVFDLEPPDINFHPHGYLCLASDAGAEQLKANFELQTELGGKVELLSPDKLKELFPWINTDGVALGCHGLQNEGWFDPWSLLQAFKRKAVSLDVRYLDAEVTGFQFKETEHYMEDDDKKYPVELLDRVVVKTEDGEHKAIQFAICIIAAGANSGEVARMAKIGTGPGILRFGLPVEPRKRYVYVIHCDDGPGIECPLLIDSNGVYFRREGLGGNYLTGKSPLPSEEPDVTNLDVDYSFFEKQVWPNLAQRVPCFEAIKLKTAWAGYYDYNSFDQNGIFGFHPLYTNLFFATGFSGHGIQQSPAVGRAVSELCLEARYKTIDLSRLDFNRLVENQPIYEKNIF